MPRAEPPARPSASPAAAPAIEPAAAPGRSSQSRFVLLGLLHTRPGSGYDLRRRIDGSIGYFWRESWGQIYPALRRLEAEKLVKARVEAGEGRPDRRVYAITGLGRQALREWLLDPPRPPVPRNELLLKLFFGNEVPLEENLRMVEERREECLARLATFEQLERIIDEGPEQIPCMPFSRMTLRYGLHQARAELAWCRETASELRRLPSTQTRSSPD